MKSAQVAALAALFSAGALAAPHPGHQHGLLKHAALHRKRDVVWETVWEIETITVVRTVTDDGSAPTATSLAATAASTAATTLIPSTPATTQAWAVTLASPSETGASTAASPASVAESSTTDVSTPALVATTATSATSVSVQATTAALPETTTSIAAPAPVSTSTAAPAAATTAAVSSDSDSESYPYTGDATHWDPSLGACGFENTGTQAVVAISNALYTETMIDGNPNHATACGKTVNIKGLDGNNYPATIVDRCMGCATYDLDMSITLFNQVTNTGNGRVPGTQWGSSVVF